MGKNSGNPMSSLGLKGVPLISGIAHLEYTRFVIVLYNRFLSKLRDRQYSNAFVCGVGSGWGARKVYLYGDIYPFSTILMGTP